MLPSDCVRAVRLVGDLVAAEQEAERDQQTARRDERDHVAHAGEQDLAGAGAPADAACRRRARRACLRREPSTRAAFGLSAAASASATILSGSLMARLTPEATTGLPAKRCLSLTPTSVAKMTASAPAIVDAASGVLPDEPCVSTCRVDARFLGGGDERVGGHVGVRDAGRACRDRRPSVLGLSPRRGFAAAAAGVGLLGAGLSTSSTSATTSSAVDASRSDCDEVLAHQCPREAGQQLHVLGAARLRRRDQEREVRGAVGRAEVDGRVQPGEPDGGGVDVRRPAVRDRDAAGQPGGRLLLAGHRRGGQAVGVGGAPGVGERGRRAGRSRPACRRLRRRRAGPDRRR